ncbi:hypothetical protein BGZ59_001945, partial [Podila verticillata]
HIHLTFLSPPPWRIRIRSTMSTTMANILKATTTLSNHHTEHPRIRNTQRVIICPLAILIKTKPQVVPSILAGNHRPVCFITARTCSSKLLALYTSVNPSNLVHNDDADDADDTDVTDHNDHTDFQGYLRIGNQ